MTILAPCGAYRRFVCVLGLFLPSIGRYIWLLPGRGHVCDPIRLPLPLSSLAFLFRLVLLDSVGPLLQLQLLATQAIRITIDCRACFIIAGPFLRAPSVDHR